MSDRSSFLGRRSAVFVVLVASSMAACSASDTGEAWRHDFESAEAEARERGLPILLHFHASWCGPCRQMEATVLHDPSLLRQLRRGFVAVKVDAAVRKDLVERFKIERLPSDVFLDPRGFLMERSVGPHERGSYLAMLARVEARFTESRAALIASQCTPVVRDTDTPPRPTPAPLAPAPGRSGVSVPVSIVNRPPLAARSPQSTPVTSRRSILGLRGFSPVSLADARRWVRGDERLACDFKGILYYMVSMEEVQRFRESPDRYAPQILGCDPVILDVTDRAVPGDVRYAAYFDGELYLFVSEKSRTTFRQDPERYVRTKHVLKVDDIDDERL